MLANMRRESQAKIDQLVAEVECLQADLATEREISEGLRQANLSRELNQSREHGAKNAANIGRDLGCDNSREHGREFSREQEKKLHALECELTLARQRI